MSPETPTPSPAEPGVPGKITDLNKLTPRQLIWVCINTTAMAAKGARPAIEYWAPGLWRQRAQKVCGPVLGKALDHRGEGEKGETLVRVWVDHLWQHLRTRHPELCTEVEVEAKAAYAERARVMARQAVAGIAPPSRRLPHGRPTRRLSAAQAAVLARRSTPKATGTCSAHIEPDPNCDVCHPRTRQLGPDGRPT